MSNELTTSTNTAIAPFGSVSGFETAQRMAQALSSSTIAPADFRGNIGNVLIAMEIASRTGSSVLAVMQSLYIVHGRPGWSGQYCIAALNKSGKFAEPVHFEFQGTEGQDDWGCRAVTVSKTGQRIEGPLVTIALAKAEGWYTRQGSKWKTIPELMLRYRSAAWLAKTEAPEILMGMQTVEELADMGKPAEKPAEGVTLESLKAAEPEPQEQPAVEPEWPKWDEDASNWVDSDAVLYYPNVHVNGDPPPVTNAGCFRARRGKSVEATELADQARAPNKAPAPADRAPQPNAGGEDPPWPDSPAMGDTPV